MPRNTESVPSPFCLVFKKNRQVKTAQHLSRRKFRDNLLDIDADWLTPIKEKSSKLAEKSKREAIAAQIFPPYSRTTKGS